MNTKTLLNYEYDILKIMADNIHFFKLKNEPEETMSKHIKLVEKLLDFGGGRLYTHEGADYMIFANKFICDHACNSPVSLEKGILSFNIIFEGLEIQKDVNHISLKNISLMSQIKIHNLFPSEHERKLTIQNYVVKNILLN